jgi:hypothetical protein
VDKDMLDEEDDGEVEEVHLAEVGDDEDVEADIQFSDAVASATTFITGRRESIPRSLQLHL